MSAKTITVSSYEINNDCHQSQPNSMNSEVLVKTHNISQATLSHETLIRNVPHDSDTLKSDAML